MDSSAAHVVEDQSAVLALLSAPETHGLSSPPIRIDTHGAVVFLAGENAYKLKRAVRFPFMDLSTLARRKEACEAEVAVNAANAPTVYLGVLPVTRGASGLALGGSGEAVEWLVHMRRFDETKTLDVVAARQGLSPALLAKLVQAILTSHARAPLREGRPAAESLRRYLQQNREAFGESLDLFPAERVERLTVLSQELLAQCWALLLERGRAGHVRRCHGDLHLRNIVLLDDEPTLFDALEFDNSVATGDVLYDLAFLLMDLWERGLGNEANLVLNRYLWGGDEEHLRGLRALPILLSIRAAIRAKVIAASLPHLSGAKQREMEEEARQYFAAAESFLQMRRPTLIAIGGLSGSGKTTLAAAIAASIGLPPGAIHLRSDIERKRLAGIGETDSLPEATYTQAASETIYVSLRRKAKLVLETGYSVIVDAVHARPDERDAIAIVAEEGGILFQGLWLDAPVSALMQRVRTRSGDASDATVSVVREQIKHELGPIDWHRLNTGGDIGEIVSRALGDLEGGRRAHGEARAEDWT